MALKSDEVREILTAIREVEANLAYRETRVEAAVTMTWGLCAAAVFAFYHLAFLDLAFYMNLFGVFFNWVWVGPIGLGLVVSFVSSAHLGRITDDAAATRARWVSFGATAAATALVVGLVVAGYGAYIPAFWLLYVPATAVVATAVSRETVPRRWWAYRVASVALGLVLLVAQPAWSWLAAAAFFGILLTGFGYLDYRDAA